MIQSKPKKCKGTGKAKSHGCGKMATHRKYGLCMNCYRTWLLTTDAGKEIIQKNTLQASKKVAVQKKKEANAKKREMKEIIKKKSDYQRELQTIINEIVRIIDDGKGCISCEHGWINEWTRQKHAGHRLAVGGHPELRYNLYNNHLQCSICNNHLSGNERNYDKGLKQYYGDDYFEMVMNLQATYPSLQLGIPELKEAIITAKEIRKKLLNGYTFTRKEINDKLGLY